MNTRHTPIVKWRRIQTNCVKTIIIFIFTWKQNKHTQITQFARQKKKKKKDRGCLKQLYEAIIPIWWQQLSKHAIIKQNNKNHANHRNEDNPPKRNQKNSSNFRH